MQNARAVGDRIEALVQELGTHGDARAQETARELVQLLMEFYGAGLERIVRLAGETGPEAFLQRLCEEPLVASLLLLHELHPVDATTRVRAALQKVRPFLLSQGGDVELVAIEDGRARLRLVAGEGCGSGGETLRRTVELAVEEAAPELAGLEVEEVAKPAPPAPLIQIQLRAKAPREAASGG